MEYQTEGRLMLAEMGGQIYVASANNVEWLKAFVERGEKVQLNPTKNKKTGEPWVWVNPPNGNPFPTPGPNNTNEQRTEPLTLGKTSYTPAVVERSVLTPQLAQGMTIEEAVKLLDAKLGLVLKGIEDIKGMAG